MNNYLLKKIGEEASEVAQAVFKHLLHRDRPSKFDLLGEMADMQAMLNRAKGKLSRRELAIFHQELAARIKREDQNGKW
jgi:phosphoribosyl-ATP pyrophosphohydrolase